MGYSGFLKLAAWIVAVPTLLVAALVAYVHFGDLNWLRPHIESVVARHSDFELSLDGEFDLKLFPDPALVVERASLNGSAPGVGDLAVSLGHLSGRVRMDSLLSGPIRVADLKVADLDAARATAEAAPEPSGDGSQAGNNSGLPLLVETAELTNIRISNESAPGQFLLATLENASIRQEATDQVTFSANGLLGGTALKPPGIAVVASLNAQFKPDSIALDDLNLQVGENVASGNLLINTGERLSITGAIESANMDLSPLVEADASHATQSGTGTGHESGKASRYVFGDEQLPLATLGSADVDLRLVNRKLVLDRFLLLDIETHIQLEAGNLLLSNYFHGPEGGRAATRLKIDASRTPAAVDADIKARDLRLNLISGDISEKSLIPPLDMTVELTATGNSPRELAASSHGRILVSLREGRIANNMVGLFIGDFMKQLFGKLNPFAEKDGYSALQCTIVGMDITDGDVDFTGMLLQTDKVKAIGDGVIDLGTEELKAEFETQPREGLGISASMFVTPFIGLEGTLAKPRMTLRKKSAVVAVATGGLSLLAKGITGRAAGQSGDCRPLMEKIGGHPPLD